MDYQLAPADGRSVRAGPEDVPRDRYGCGNEGSFPGDEHAVGSGPHAPWRRTPLRELRGHPRRSHYGAVCGEVASLLFRESLAGEMNSEVHHEKQTGDLFRCTPDAGWRPIA